MATMFALLLSLTFISVAPPSLQIAFNDAARESATAQSQARILNDHICQEQIRLDAIPPPFNADLARWRSDMATANSLLSMSRGHLISANGLIATGLVAFDQGAALWEAGRLTELHGNDGSQCYAMAAQKFAAALAAFLAAESECRDGTITWMAAKAIIDPYYPIITWWDWIFPR